MLHPFVLLSCVVVVLVVVVVDVVVVDDFVVVVVVDVAVVVVVVVVVVVIVVVPFFLVLLSQCHLGARSVRQPPTSSTSSRTHQIFGSEVSRALALALALRALVKARPLRTSGAGAGGRAGGGVCRTPGATVVRQLVSDCNPNCQVVTPGSFELIGLLKSISLHMGKKQGTEKNKKNKKKQEQPEDQEHQQEQ